MAPRRAFWLAISTCALASTSCLSVDAPRAGTGGADAGGGGGGHFSRGGQGGAASGGASGALGGDRLYQHDPATGAWSKTPLAVAWVGNDAPPSTGIVAATELELFDRLLVFTGDGYLYRRFDGVWQTPIPVVQAFSAIAGIPVMSVYHTPSDPGAPPDETVSVVSNPGLYKFAYHSNDVIEFKTVQALSDAAPPAPHAATGHVLFDFEVRDPSAYPSAGYNYDFFGYDDGNLYRVDAAGAWTSWPFAQSPYFAPGGSGPEPSKISAAWTHAATGVVYFVAP